MSRRYPQVKTMGSPAELRHRLGELGLDLPVDDDVEAAPDGALAQPLVIGDRTVGNRLAVLPMEGWDATTEGRPTDLVRRRWRRFGESGAKLIWGGEAVAVRPDGRANPNQLAIGPRSGEDLAELRGALVGAHEAVHGTSDDLLVGLQLTHSGRWSRPEGTPAPRTARRHPVLDARVGIADGAGGDASVLGDDELDELAGAYVAAAEVAATAGFGFVDVKACHGYLLHELLGGYERSGRYGGPALEDRARFLVEVIAEIRRRCPDLAVGVRLSVYDVAPYRAGADGVGEPEWSAGAGPAGEPARFGGRFPWRTAGADQPVGVDEPVDVDEPTRLVGLLAEAGASLLCVSAGSPYYNPHIQRPAYFPPSDGYQPPEDPLVGVARMQHATRALAEAHPEVGVVGSGLSYLQDWFGHVAQPLVADGWMAAAGLGRMVLSYPRLPADLLAGGEVDRRAICRTFSDCTTAPRNGMVSGCYPLDAFYKDRPERLDLAAVKKRQRQATRPEDGDR